MVPSGWFLVLKLMGRISCFNVSQRDKLNEILHGWIIINWLRCCKILKIKRTIFITVWTIGEPEIEFRWNYQPVINSGIKFHILYKLRMQYAWVRKCAFVSQWTIYWICLLLFSSKLPNEILSPLNSMLMDWNGVWNAATTQ